MPKMKPWRIEPYTFADKEIRIVGPNNFYPGQPVLSIDYDDNDLEQQDAHARNIVRHMNGEICEGKPCATCDDTGLVKRENQVHPEWMVEVSCTDCTLGSVQEMSRISRIREEVHESDQEKFVEAKRRQTDALKVLEAGLTTRARSFDSIQGIGKSHFEEVATKAWKILNGAKI